MNIKILGTVAVVALLAACSNHDTTASTGAGAATTSGPVPGSEEDLVANVGDRVFFDFNRSALRADASATLDKQAGVARQISRRSTCRWPAIATTGAPRSTTSPSASAVPTPSRDYLGARGVTLRAHQHDQLWQGSSDRSWRQRAGLGAEPQHHHLGSLNGNRLSRRAYFPTGGRVAAGFVYPGPALWSDCMSKRAGKADPRCSASVLPIVLAQSAEAQVESREGIALQNQILELATAGTGAAQSATPGAAAPPISAAATRPRQPATSSSDLVAQLLSRVDASGGAGASTPRPHRRDAKSGTAGRIAMLGKRIDEWRSRRRARQAGAPPAGRAPSPAGEPDRWRHRPTTAGPVPRRQPPPPLAPVRSDARIGVAGGQCGVGAAGLPAAEAAAREVLTGSRTSPRAYDAQFLLAQSLMGQRQYSQAAIAYDDTYNRSRTGKHAPDALLGLANALIAINEKKAACDTIGKLAHRVSVAAAGSARTDCLGRATGGMPVSLRVAPLCGAMARSGRRAARWPSAVSGGADSMALALLAETGCGGAAARSWRSSWTTGCARSRLRRQRATRAAARRRAVSLPACCGSRGSTRVPALAERARAARYADADSRRAPRPASCICCSATTPPIRPRRC